MKKNIQNPILATICLVFFTLHVNAQNHKSYIASTNEALPQNRTAFLFCYNNVASYKNPATEVLNQQQKTTNKLTVEKKTKDEIRKERIRMFSNITEDELWIELDNKLLQTQQLSVEIYNASGERVYNSKVEQNLHKVNVCDFTSGTFLVKLGDSVQKMVIE